MRRLVSGRPRAVVWTLWLVAAALAPGGQGRAQDLVRSEDAVVALFSLQTELEIDARMLDRLARRHEANRQERAEAVDRVDRLYARLDDLFALYREAIRSGSTPDAGQEGAGRRGEGGGPAASVPELEAQLEEAERDLREAERSETAVRDEGRRLREEMRLLHERMVLLSQKIEALQGSMPSQKETVTGVWDVTFLPSGDRGVFALFQSGTIVTGQYVLDGPFQGSLEGTLIDRKILLHRIDARLGRTMDLAAFLSPDGRALRGTWENYDLSSGQARTGSWAASRRQRRAEETGEDREGGP